MLLYRDSRKYKQRSRPQGYKTVFTLNSTEHEINPAYKC